MVSKNQEFWRLRKMIQNFEKLDAELLEKFNQAIKEKYKWDVPKLGVRPPHLTLNWSL